MIKARRIGHAVFETSDLDRLTEHYTDVIGLTVAAREKDKVFLASKLGHLAVELRRGSNVSCRKLSFEVTAGTNLADVESDLKKHGVQSARSNDTAPGIAKSPMLTFRAVITPDMGVVNSTALLAASKFALATS